MIKRINLSLLLVSLASLFIMPGVVLAQGQAVQDLDTLCTQDAYSGSSMCVGWGKGRDDTNTDNPLINTIRTVIDVFAFFGGVLAVIFVMWGGFKYITSNGAPDKAAAGRKAIIYALVGVVVIALARTLILFVLGRLL